MSAWGSPGATRGALLDSAEIIRIPPKLHDEGERMAINEQEQQQIEQANASGKTPAVFIHGAA